MRGRYCVVCWINSLEGENLHLNTLFLIILKIYKSFIRLNYVGIFSHECWRIKYVFQNNIMHTKKTSRRTLLSCWAYQQKFFQVRRKRRLDITLVWRIFLGMENKEKEIKFFRLSCDTKIKRLCTVHNFTLLDTIEF